MSLIMKPTRQTSVQGLQKAVSEWELRVAEHESRFNVQIDETTKLSAMKMMMPHAILDRYIDTVTTYLDLKSRLTNYMTEYMSNGMGPKSGPVPMDVGSLESSDQGEGLDDPISKLTRKVEELCALDRKGKGKSKQDQAKAYQNHYKPYETNLPP